ncbi:MAG: hypothetical protein Kow0069_19760 [Promethearchaeota archaeon]
MAQLDWNLIVTVVTGILAFLVFLFSFNYARKELRVAPRNTTAQKFVNRFASFIYAAVFTAVVVFIIVIITSTLSIRWLDYIYAVGDTETLNEFLAAHPQYYGTPEWDSAFANENDWRPWWDALYEGRTPDYEPIVIHPPPLLDTYFIASLQFPTFIPITLIAIFGFIIIYPFVESAYLAKRGSDAPTEIQQWWEINLVDRFRPPGNVIMSVIGLGLLYLLPVFLIIYGISELHLVQTVVPEGWWMPVLAWFMVMPLLYLGYYASFGVVTMFQESRRKVVASLKENRKINLKDKQEMLDFIKFVVSIVLLASMVYGFVNMISRVTNLWFFQENVEWAAAGESGANEFIVELINFFLFVPQMKQDFQTFVAILPFDLLIFILTSVGLALYGFYSKFLSKEPLNRPVLVFFASYILAAVGIQVFLNVMTKYPQVYPSRLLFKSYDTITENEAYWTDMAAIFSIALFADKTIVIVFVVYNLLFNKSLVRNIEEKVLNFAILNDRTDILREYTKNPEESVRKRVVDSALFLVKERPPSYEAIIPLFDDFSDDVSKEIVKLANEGIEIIGTDENFEQIELLVPTFASKLNHPSEDVRNSMAKTIAAIGKKYPKRIIRVLPSLLTQEMSREGLEMVVWALKEVGTVHPGAVAEIVVPLASLENEKIRLGAMEIAKFVLSELKDQFDVFFPKMMEATSDPNDAVRHNAIEILGLMAVIKPSLFDPVLAKLEELKTGPVEVKRRVIQATCNIVSSFPDRLDQIMPMMHEMADDPVSEVREDLALGLSVAGTFFVESESFQKFQPVMDKLLSDPTERVRFNIAHALYLLCQANPDLFAREEGFRAMMLRAMTDENKEIRNKFKDAALHLAEASPSVQLFEVFVDALRTELPAEIRRDVLAALAEALPHFPVELDVSMVLDPLLEKLPKDPEARKLVVDCLGSVVTVAPHAIPKFTGLLQELSGDDDPGVQTSVVRVVGTITKRFIERPQAMPSMLTFREFFDRLRVFVETMRGPPLEETVRQLAEVYFLRKDLHAEIYPEMVKAAQNPQPSILANSIKVMTSIVTENRVEYASQEVLGELVWIKGTKFERQLLPLLIRATRTRDKAVRNELADAVNKIVEEFPEGGEIIRQVLVRTVGSKDPETKLVGVKMLGKFKETPGDPKLVKLLIRQASMKTDPEVRAAAYHSMEWVLKQISSYGKPSREMRKNLTNIIYTLLKRKVLKDPVKIVREEHVEALIHLAKLFPEHDEAYVLLKSLVADPELKISRLALEGFFKGLHKFPEKVHKFHKFFWALTKAPHRATREQLLEELRKIQELFPENLEYTLPAILGLARDPDAMIRQKSFSDFDAMQRKYPGKIFYFEKVISEMARNKQADLRRDSIRLMVSVLKNHPDFFREGNQTFKAFTDMARDVDDVVRKEVARYLPKVAELFTDATLNYLLQMLLRLVTEDDDEVKNDVIQAFRIVADKWTYRIKDFVDDLEKINKREQHPGIFHLVEDLKQKIKQLKGK